MIRNGKAIDHSNAGGVGSSVLLFLLSFGLFLGSLYAMGFWSLDNAWLAGLIALALATIAFLIPQGILGRGDTLHTQAIHGAPAVATHTVGTTTTHGSAGSTAAGASRGH
ncbi:hypothetical protein NJC10_05160 [Micrococcus sp. M4NT]|uniref:hypothetical protein n=1 Tax=Micrococcus sp. M4NT TaxID=2957501 RepID=UPI0029AE4028|nr:hypothetical protein [Micrococcus sp. M4NT]MDX2341057.1 hypothetical protein [Micrococcus sp. M4NT]